MNSYDGILEFDEYLVNNNFSYIKLNKCFCSTFGNLKVDKSIISVSDIISFAYTDLTFPKDDKDSK